MPIHEKWWKNDQELSVAPEPYEFRSLPTAIRTFMISREAVNLEELTEKLQRDKCVIHDILLKMNEMGEIEIIRPIGYEADRHDHYRLERKNREAGIRYSDARV